MKHSSDVIFLMAISESESVYCCTLKPVGRKWVGRFTRNKQLIHSGLKQRYRIFFLQAKKKLGQLGTRLDLGSHETNKAQGISYNIAQMESRHIRGQQLVMPFLLTNVTRQTSMLNVRRLYIVKLFSAESQEVVGSGITSCRHVANS